MKKLCVIVFSILFVSLHATAQENNLKKIEAPSIHTSDDVYINEKGEYFAKTFYIAFKKHITEDINQAKGIKSVNIQEKISGLKDLFSELETKHGMQNLERVYPKAIPNDTIRYSKKGKRVIVSDLSKKYKLVFDKLMSYKFIKNKFIFEEIRYVEPPAIIYSTSEYPNDSYYDLQWSLKLLEAEKVFDITKGNGDIILGISDLWTSGSVYGIHEELIGRIPTYQYGKWVPGDWESGYTHGPRIANIAAAANNNGKGIASLGGNFKVIPAGQINGLSYFINICNSYPPGGCDVMPDIINMSWTTGDYQYVEDDIEDLLEMGVILIGTSVNTLNRIDENGIQLLWPAQSTWGEPFIPYPASYNFSDGKQVIAVTATQLTDDDGSLDVTQPINPFQYEERFRFQNYGTPDEWFYNYGLSNDPLANPSTAFTDVAAPGARFFSAKGAYSTNDYHAQWGATSEAAPLVTSLVGILLSVNPSLSVVEVYDILTSTTDYDYIVVPPDAVTFNHPDGVRKYNKYLGYGRVNAFEAVKESLPYQYDDHSFSSSATLGSTHIDGATTLASGITLIVSQSEVVVLEGNISAAGNSSFEVHGKLIIDENTSLSNINVSVEDGGELIIYPGTQFEFSTGVYANMRVWEGGKITAQGTAENPIRMVQKDSGTTWGRVVLNSSEGNSFQWVLFDGGIENVIIASKNNTFAHCTFRNGWRGISGWYNQDGTGGNAEAAITYSLIEDNTSVGLVAQYLDLDMSYTTIRDNTQAGLYVHSATVYPFHHNLITANGG